MIHVYTNEYLLGDGLAQVPFMYAMAQARNERVRLCGRFNPHIMPLLADMPIDFDPSGDAAGAEFKMFVMDSFQTYHKTGLHMAQAYFLNFCQPVPDMPMTLPLRSEPCGLPPGIVISPFSGSDLGTNTKLWPHLRWVQVVQKLRQLGLADRAYVIGRQSTDSTIPYAGADITPIFDRPLTEVLDLMRQAPLVMSIDTGPGHLANFGGISKHVMVYADCMPAKFAEASRAVHVRGPMPASISVDQVVEAAQQVLQG